MKKALFLFGFISAVLLSFGGKVTTAIGCEKICTQPISTESTCPDVFSNSLSGPEDGILQPAFRIASSASNTIRTITYSLLSNASFKKFKSISNALFQYLNPQECKSTASCGLHIFLRTLLI